MCIPHFQEKMEKKKRVTAMGFFWRKKLNKEDPRQMKRELRWVLNRAKKYWKQIALIGVLGILGTVFGFGTSIASKFAVDAVTAKDSRMLLLAGGLMAVMFLGNILLQSASTRVNARVHIRVTHENQRKAYKKILRAGWEALEPYRSGDLLHRLSSDVSAVSGGMIGFIPTLFTACVRLVGALVIMLYFDPMMALIALLGVPATLVFSQMLMRPMRRHEQRIKALGGELMSFQEDSFRNLTSIKAFFITDRFTRNMHTLQDEYADAYLDANATQIRISVTSALLSAVLMGLCFCWCVYQMWFGSMSFGELTMFLQLISMLRGAFSTLRAMTRQVVSITTSAGRIMAVEELPAEDTQIPEGLTQEQTLAIRLEQVSFSYQDGDTVLHPFDFVAEDGDVIAITGPSGEGKTTLLRLLLGLVTPCDGSAVITGATGEHYPITAGTRCVFAYVPQGNSVFAGTVAENLRLVNPDATDEELKQVLEVACAWDFVEQLPNGLNHMLRAGGRGISEGQAQRLAVARALLRKAPVLLLDEATSAMDVAMEGRLLENLRASGLVRTCILVTHRPGSTAFCNRAYEIRDGVVTEVEHGA